MEIILFETKHKCPITDFLLDIENVKLQEKTLRNIAELSVVGDKARMPLSRHVGSSIFELRSK